MTFRPCPSFRAATLALGVILTAGGCGGSDSDTDATAQDVAGAEKTSITPTEQEIAAFRAPADSVLTERQVEQYLKTSLLQFDYIRQEAKGLHERARKIEERGQKGGVLSGLRNMAEGVGLMADFGNIIGGSFVRSARTQGFNPAEMEWVQERMGEVSGYLVVKPMMEAGIQSAAQMKQQAEQLREQLRAGQQTGFTEADIDEMVRNAEEMEREARENAAAQGVVLRNLEVLRKARPAVTEPMWATIGISSGSMGLLGMTGLGDPADTTSQRKLDEFRRVYTDALENRVSEGMEST